MSKFKYKRCSQCGKRKLYPRNKMKSDCCNQWFVSRIQKTSNIKQIRESVEMKRKEILDQILFELTKRKLRKDGLIGFDSYCGIIENDKPSTAILNEEQAIELGLQAVFPYSEFFWIPKTKALYIKYQDKYLSLTSEV